MLIKEGICALSADAPQECGFHTCWLMRNVRQEQMYAHIPFNKKTKLSPNCGDSFVFLYSRNEINRQFIESFRLIYIANMTRIFNLN